MFDPASRFKLVDQAVMLPGTCLITRTDKGPFVDTGMELNKFDPLWSEVNMARIYLSVDVIREMAEGIGMLDELRAAVVAAREAGVREGYEQGVNENGQLTAAADQLVSSLARLGSSPAAPEPVIEEGSGDADPAVFVTDGEPRRSVKSDDAGADGEHGTPDRQGDGPKRKRRPAGVSVDPSDGANPFRI